MMKFKNVSEKVKMFNKEGSWIQVYPGDSVELEGMANLHEVGLEQIVKNKKPIVEKLKEKPVKEDVEKVEIKSLEELSKMTKDELNDYGAVIGLKEINQRMLKDTMLKKIVAFIKRVFT